ncbi:MAG TPA: MFS transporter [Opitutaceae bacterium]|nr:MFS transporter [Opitutaceae bacterium]
MAFIDGTALSVALPSLQADLDATGPNLLWVTNGFSLPLAALLLFGGALGDHYGRRRIFITGIALFIGASMACGLAPDVSLLIATRVVQGVGAALMIPGSLAMISSYFGAAERGRAIGLWSAFSVLATTLGPVVGGILAGANLWRGVFFINVPLAILALTLLVWKVPADKAPEKDHALDWRGAIAVTLGLAAFNFGLIRWSEHPLSEIGVWGMLVAGVFGLGLFLAIQITSRQPLLPLGIFRHRVLASASVVSFLYYVAFHGTLFFLPLNLIQVQGYPPAMAGVTQVPIMVLLVSLSALAGKWVDKKGPRWPLTLGAAVTGGGFWLLALPGVTEGPAAFWSSYFPGILVIGLGLALTATPVSATLMTSVASQHLGLASGINSSLTRLAGVLAVAALGPLMLTLFGGGLLGRVAELPVTMPAAAVEQLAHEASKLGATPVPEGLDENGAEAVRGAIRWAFVDAFRWIVGIAGALCWMAAGVAALGLGKEKVSARRAI